MLTAFQISLSALRLAQKELFSVSNGGRPTVPKMLVLLTDGSQTVTSDAEDPKQIAEELRGSGITILVVGIGADTNRDELDSIAGGEDGWDERDGKGVGENLSKNELWYFST